MKRTSRETRRCGNGLICTADVAQQTPLTLHQHCERQAHELLPGDWPSVLSPAHLSIDKQPFSSSILQYKKVRRQAVVREVK